MTSYLMTAIVDDTLIVYDHYDYRGVIMFDPERKMLIVEKLHLNRENGNVEHAKDMFEVQYSESAIHAALLHICTECREVNLMLPNNVPSSLIFYEDIRNFNSIIEKKLK